MNYCRNCDFIGYMESEDGIPICPDCGQDDTEEYLAYLIDKYDA